MLQDILVISGMFFLRLGLPLLILFGIGYALERLLNYEEQDRVTTRDAIPQLPEEVTIVPKAVPAWSMMPCASRVSRAYNVLGRPTLPCWLALELAEGRLLDQCPACQWYRPKIAEREVVGVSKGRHAS